MADSEVFVASLANPDTSLGEVKSTSEQMSSTSDPLADISDDLEPVGSEPISGGSFSDVYKYRHRGDGRLMAVKVIRNCYVDEKMQKESREKKTKVSDDAPLSCEIHKCIL